MYRATFVASLCLLNFVGAAAQQPSHSLAPSVSTAQHASCLGATSLHTHPRGDLRSGCRLHYAAAGASPRSSRGVGERSRGGRQGRPGWSGSGIDGGAGRCIGLRPRVRGGSRGLHCGARPGGAALGAGIGAIVGALTGEPLTRTSRMASTDRQRWAGVPWRSLGNILEFPPPGRPLYSLA